jgi:predicted protein tyrosine phosphatase
LEEHRKPIQGRRYAFQVLSRRDVKHLAPEVPYVVISITDVSKTHPVLVESPFCLGVLPLFFDDVEPTRKEYYGSKRPMSREQAAEIRQFVEAHLEQVELVVVNCEAGMCRSPAVAAALWRWLEPGRASFFEAFRPNGHVYRTLLEALR